MEEIKITGAAEAINKNNEEYKTSLTSSVHHLITDEPEAAGGNNEGPSPIDYLCMSLAGCKSITLRMYCKRKQWDAGDIKVKVKLLKSMGATAALNTFNCEISISGSLTGEQKDRLLQIAKACPVSKIISAGSEVISVIIQ